MILVCALASCKKDETSIPKLEDYRYKPLYGAWFLKSKILVGSASDTTTVLGFTTTDFYKFNEDNTYEFSASSPSAKSSGYYSYKNEDTEVLTIGDNRPAGTAYTISQLTSESLTFYNRVITATDTVKVIYQFSRN